MRGIRQRGREQNHPAARRNFAAEGEIEQSVFDMIMFKWSELDLTEFFGVVSKFHEDANSYSFEVNRDGLRLLVTLFDLEGAVYVSILREGLPEPLFTVRRELCTHAHVTGSTNFRRCFEAGTTKHPVTDMGIPPQLERGVRVYIEPQFQVELIEPRYEESS